MSFLVDPPLLVGAGAATAAVSPDQRTTDTVRRVTIAVFLVTSISLYFERRWVAWMWKMMGSRSGRDWMINSRVTDFEFDDPPWVTHVAGAAIFATYPWWFRLGERLAAKAGVAGRFAVGGGQPGVDMGSSVGDPTGDEDVVDVRTGSSDSSGTDAA